MAVGSLSGELLFCSSFPGPAPGSVIRQSHSWFSCTPKKLLLGHSIVLLRCSSAGGSLEIGDLGSSWGMRICPGQAVLGLGSVALGL